MVKLNKDSNKKGVLEREERINNEIEKLRDTLRDLELKDKKMKLANSLIENAGFMIVTLEDLQSEINKNGCVSEYQNGENQWGTKQSDEVKTYISLINKHSSIMKQLIKLFPEDEKQEDVESALEAFAKSRSK